MLAIHFVMEFLFGALEAFATLLLSFALFRIPFRPFFYHLIGLSSIVSGACLLLYNLLNIPFFAGEIFILSFVGLVIWRSLSVKVWQSFLVTIVGYIGAQILLGIGYIILSYIGYLDGDMVSNTEEGLLELMTLQFFSGVIAIHFCVFLYRYRIGFVFIKPSRSGLKLQSSEHIQYLVIVLLTIFGSVYMAHLAAYDSGAYSIYKGLFFIVLNLLSIGVVYLLNRENLLKEYKNISENIHL
jgi:hypothetical protein